MDFISTESFITIIIALALGYVSSFIGSLIGGGGLFLTGALLEMGIPAPIAIGSKRIGSIGGFISSFLRFKKDKKVDTKLLLPISIIYLTGILIALYFFDYSSKINIKRLIGVVVLVSIALLFAQEKNFLKKIRLKSSLATHIIGGVFLFIAAIINIISGGGGGFLIALILMLIYNKNLLETAGTKKIPLIAGNLIASIYFLANGFWDIQLTIALFIGRTIGGWMGADFFIKREKIAKKVFYLLMLACGLKFTFF